MAGVLLWTRLLSVRFLPRLVPPLRRACLLYPLRRSVSTTTTSLRQLLSTEQTRIVEQEKRTLKELMALLQRVEASHEEKETLRQCVHQLDELFLLVVVGEFNSGKSTLVNALLGGRYLRDGVTPTTQHLHRIRFGDAPQTPLLVQEEDPCIELRLPVEFLRDLVIVDSPGTNAVTREHQVLTEAFVPRCDLVLFVTSADRPFTASEDTFLRAIHMYGKKVLFIVNKIDILETTGQVDEVTDYVRMNAQRVIGVECPVFPVSSRLALQAKLDETEHNRIGRWQQSQFGALESFIHNHLDTGERVRLKISNPLGTAFHFIQKYLHVLEGRRTMLAHDKELLCTLEHDLNLFLTDLQDDLQHRMEGLDRLVDELHTRSDRFFQRKLQFSNTLELIRKAGWTKQFHEEVTEDLAARIDRHVEGIQSWMIDRSRRQWKGVMDYLEDRLATQPTQVVGTVDLEFLLNRKDALAETTRSATERISRIDKEGDEMDRSVRRAMLQAVAFQASVLGLGTVAVKALALPGWGVVGLGVLTASALLTLPYQRNRLKREMRHRLDVFHEHVSSLIHAQFEAVVEGSVHDIHEAMEPYRRFVKLEMERSASLDHDLHHCKEALQDISCQIE